MVRFSVPVAMAVLDLIASRGSVIEAARAIGCGDNTIFVWVRDSSIAQDNDDQDSKFYFAGWPRDAEDANERKAWFHEYYNLARKLQAMKLGQEAAALALNGYEEVVMIDGVVQYLIDHKLIGQCEGDAAFARDVLGIKDPFYKHSPDGARIPLTRHVKPSSQFLIAALRALVPQPYNVPDKRELDVTGQLQVYHPPSQPTRVSGPGSSPLRDDLEKRLAAKRAGMPALPAPAPAPREADDQPDDQNNRPPPAPSQVPEIAADLQRVLTPPQKHERPQTGDARPNRGEQIGYGKPPPGGYKAV